MALKDQILAIIDADEDVNLKFLSSLIQIPSGNPPGDTRPIMKFIQDDLASRGINSSIVAPKVDAPNLICRLHDESEGSPAAKARKLVLNGHIDVFPLNEDEQWQRDPFSGEIEDGFVHGRGAVDMKAGTAAHIIAFTYLHKFRSQLAGQCTLEVVSDEETGGKFGTKYLIEQDANKDQFRGDCMLNAEPGGMQSIRFGEKGTLRITFEVNTTGAHGAFRHLSEGAIRIATRLVTRLIALEDMPVEGMDPDLREYFQRLDVRKVVDHIMGEGAAKYMVKPSVNIGTIRGGVKVNMIPSYCVFEVDIRMPIGLTKEFVLEAIQRILQDFPEVSYAVQEAATNRAAASDKDHELVKLLQQNAVLVRGEIPLPICSLGATDCKHFRFNGIPAYCLGPSPKTMAQVDERVKAQEFLDLIKIHTLTAIDYLSATK